MKPALVLALCLLAIPFSTAAPEAPADPVARALGNALGLRLNEYAFSWNGEEFSSCQVLVASDEQKLAAGVGDLWDSGRRALVKGSDFIVYRGRALGDGSTVWWKVRGFGPDNEAGAWSAAQELRVPNGADSQKRVRRPGGGRRQASICQGAGGAGRADVECCSGVE